MKPKLGQTVYDRTTGKPWLVAGGGTGKAITLRSECGQFRRWEPGKYWLRRRYRPRCRTTPVHATTGEQALTAYSPAIVRLAANLGLTCEEVAAIRGDLVGGT
jgi:hypothetical protein